MKRDPASSRPCADEIMAIAAWSIRIQNLKQTANETWFLIQFVCRKTKIRTTYNWLWTNLFFTCCVDYKLDYLNWLRFSFWNITAKFFFQWHFDYTERNSTVPGEIRINPKRKTMYQGKEQLNNNMTLKSPKNLERMSWATEYELKSILSVFRFLCN